MSSSTQLRPTERTRPFVAVVCAVPLLGEAMEFALDFAEVRSFSATGGDINGLLGWLRPDALIVDSEDGAQEALEFARENELPVLHVAVRENALHLFRGGAWEDVGNGSGPEPEMIRNVLAGVLFARGGATTMNAADQTAILDGLELHDELRATVDERTLEIVDRRRRSAVVRSARLARPAAAADRRPRRAARRDGPRGVDR